MAGQFVTLNIMDFGGRMHPVLVHLPIGILMLVCLYYIFAGKEKRQSQYSFISVALLFGMLSAIAACISGLLLANGGDYEAAVVFKHQWMGITVAIVAVICYVMHRLQTAYLRAGMIVLVLATTLAGHLGGSITHGEDYLTAAFSTADAPTTVKPISNVQEAVVYNDIIKPILSSKCYSCHGNSKQKGELRLDEPAAILKGGKEGAAIEWDNADKSHLIERILLPETDKKHMPPKEKPQLTQNETALLQWWVNSRAGFDKKVNQSIVSEQIKPVLKALETGVIKQEARPGIIPDKEVAKADDKTINALKQKGIVAIPVATNSNYLSVNFVGADKVTAEELKLLELLKDQVIWLKAGYANLKDEDMKVVGSLSNLMRLHIEGNPVTDAGLSYLKELKQLRYINLSDTKISEKGPAQLEELKLLEQVYLYKITGVSFDLPALKNLLPKAKIDTGGYNVPILESDTTIFKGVTEM
jgi:uncharacterized membrane protein/mono/diheme cytochrome c family protein